MLVCRIEGVVVEPLLICRQRTGRIIELSVLFNSIRIFLLLIRFKYQVSLMDLYHVDSI
jgi:hypothetical protein